MLDSKEINNVDYVVADIEKYIGNCDYDVVYCVIGGLRGLE